MWPGYKASHIQEVSVLVPNPLLADDWLPRRLGFSHKPAGVTELGQRSIIPQNQSISHFLLLHKAPHGLPKAAFHEAPLEKSHRVHEPDQAKPLPAAEDQRRGRGTQGFYAPHIASLELRTEVADIGGKEKALIVSVKEVYFNGGKKVPFR